MNKTLFAALFAACAFAAQAQASSTIRFGVDPTFAPYESVNAKGDLIGIDIDMGNAICKQLNAKCEWVKINFDGAIPALNAQKIDGILSGMSITKQREKQVLFTIPFYSSASLMMVPKKVTLDTTVASLKGKTIGIVQGTTQAAYANKHWKGKGIKLVSYQNDNLAKQDLALGRVDGTLQDSASAQSFFATPEGKGFHLTGTPVNDAEVFGNGTGIGLRLADHALKNKIDGAVKSMRKDGEFQKILARYSAYGLIGPTGQ
ncbi:MAG: transporter substrate-binding domain-containing protein [Candidimonas sp.]|nr:MAG: transporter substrate-binding domain-containing protein [Candidimonas sp.]TAM22667.1 MAG: transporter substrate-binding domain-containing protein [Candidimonas sp.]TAM74460.1 MAG: transporter substrate-binding domain-containing protein [Candidimonas sp.]